MCIWDVVNTEDSNLVITVPVAAPEPNGAGSSAVTVLDYKARQILFKVPLSISNLEYDLTSLMTSFESFQ